MGHHWLGMAVVGDHVTIVDADVPDEADQPITVLSDDTWKLQQGDRAAAYAVIHQRCADYIREQKIGSVMVKASALPTGSARLALLTGAELRGVIIAAAASHCVVRQLSKGVISRTYGERKVDEYLKDDAFWDEQTTGGKLRKTSREAAMLLVAARPR